MMAGIVKVRRPRRGDAAPAALSATNDAGVRDYCGGG